MTGNSYISIGMYYYHGDHLGSATWITDTNGLPVQYILYDPWGGQFANRSAYGSSGVTERYTFTGQRFGLARAEKNELASFAMPSVRNENKRSAVKEFDEETKYYNFEARQYDHWLRIFTAPDPLSDQTPDISPYAYCAWNPLKYIDPTGKKVKVQNPNDHQMILNTIPVQLWNRIKFSKHGNVRIIGKHKTESNNFEALRTLVNDKKTYEINTGNEFSYKNQFGDIIIHNMQPVIFDEDFLEGDFGMNTGETGFLGVTQTPGAKEDKYNSTDNVVRITINETLSEDGKAQVLSHEAYGHALLYSKGIEHRHQPQEGKETNSILSNAISRAIKETIFNMKGK